MSKPRKPQVLRVKSHLHCQMIWENPKGCPNDAVAIYTDYDCSLPMCQTCLDRAEPDESTFGHRIPIKVDSNMNNW